MNRTRKAIYINDHLSDFDLDEALTRLSEQRREQALRFKHEAGRRQCTAAYLLLCEALTQEYGITEKPVFEYGPHGKPFIIGHPEIFFNLSHCREAAVCVVSDTPVGIDVESIREYKDTLVRYTMNDDEIAQILGNEQPDVAFISLWTRKEAVLKLSGEGISKDMKDVLVGYNRPIDTFVVESRGYIYSVAR
ncbi:MAG: 4'-phosphopantetheinyl transferase superfamily protein [Bacteroidaceae bacterium]|nr:4'-phosphopantetheinyl transferase superfamily protein [Bacteroidaceae bacterium]